MKSKTTAGILALLLGSLGAHRFYLGQTGKGFLYLAFIWTSIPFWISLFDGIVFLTMDERKFDAKYNYLYAAQAATGQPTVVINNTVSAAPAAPAAAPTTAAAPEPVAQGLKKDPFERDGDKLYEDYDFDGAIAKYRKSLNVNSKNEGVHFKLACLYSILEDKRKSLFHLDRAVDFGYYNLDEIDNHDHLAYLRSQPEFVNFKENGFRPVRNIEPPKQDTLDITEDVISQIERLAQLRDEGIISGDDFEKQKHRLFND